MIHVGDITKLKGSELEPVTCIVGGSPCQNLSVAGNREGLAGQESKLFHEQIRLIREMREATNGVYPKLAIWENVAGAFSSGVYEYTDGNGKQQKFRGEDYRVVLEEFCRIADPTAAVPRPPKKWERAGLIIGDDYSIAWRLFNAQYWGVSQRRRRVAVICCFGDSGRGEAAKILFERYGLPGYTEPIREPWKDIAPALGPCAIRYDSVAGGKWGVKPYTLQMRSGCAGGGKGPLVKEDLSASLTTTNTQTLFQPVYTVNQQGGSGVDVQENVASCLTAGLNSGNNSCSVVYGISAYNSNSMKSSNPYSCIYEADTARTLDCVSCGSPACNQGGMAVVQPIAADMYNGAITGDTTATLTSGRSDCHCVPTVLQPIASNEQDVVGTICADIRKGTSNQIWDDGHIIFQPVVDGTMLIDSIGGQSESAGLTDTCPTLKASHYKFPPSVVVPQSWNGEQVAPTLTANNAGGNQRMPDKDNFNCILQPVAYGLEPRLASRQGGHYYENYTATLLANTGDNKAAVAYPVYGIGRDAFNMGKNAQFAMQIAENVSPTVIAKGPGAVCAPVYCVRPEMTPKVSENTAPTLEARDTHKEDGICQALTQRMGTGGGNIPLVLEGTVQPAGELMPVAAYPDYLSYIRWIVRRLTPLECSRLQGFPDNWLDIGEWVDSKGKKHKDADGPKYKALGNSIALPQWYWIFWKAKQLGFLQDGSTLGSLFDGIGGFPLCFEHLFGKGSARWASEIEEFPIAVTKLRFPEPDSWYEDWMG